MQNSMIFWKNTKINPGLGGVSPLPQDPLKAEDRKNKEVYTNEKS